MFLRGYRHGFARRYGRPLKHGRARLAVWVVAIALLIGFETYQFVRGATTATALMSPLLAVPVLRVLALMFWARLGRELMRS